MPATLQTTAQCPNSPPGHLLRGMARSHSKRDFESATARLLTQGGDTRIELNAAGINSYGCGPRPDARLLQFGSSTGSVISAAGFQAAVALYRRLYSSTGSYSDEVERQRHELSWLSGASRLLGSELVFAASGTDIHLIAAHLAALGQSTSLQAVMVEPEETGSGVPAALSALHFSTQTSQGHSVTLGAALGNAPMQPPAFVNLRLADGRLRSEAEVDAEFVSHVTRQTQAGGRCLLVLTDLSKTGLIAPSLACAKQMLALYGEKLTVLVDACQFRLSSDTLLGYLAQDFMVAITGSKFVGGPAFCGALLLPPGMAERSRAAPLAALVAYSARSDWPPGWLAAKALAAGANLGLLLRWEAALAELRRFKAVPDQVVHDFLQQWQQAVSRRLVLDDSFEPLPVAALKRTESSKSGAWDNAQTIFSFQVFKPNRPDGRQALNMSETALLYSRVGQTDDGIRFQLGQPVPCRLRGATPVTALRMCSSARLVTDTFFGNRSVEQAISQAMLAFDKLAMLLQTFRSIMAPVS